MLSFYKKSDIRENKIDFILNDSKLKYKRGINILSDYISNDIKDKLFNI